MIKLGILGSTRGTSMLALIDAIQNYKLDAKINIVMSNKPAALILTRAQSAGLPSQFVDPVNHDRETYDKKLSDLLQKADVDLVLLIGYMRILSASFVATWKNKILNVHPSLLPAFGGLMDLDVHQAVLQSGVKQTGCTIHYVTDAVDQGEIILQKTCAVHLDDTPEVLKQRVQALEGAALIEAIQSFFTSMSY